MSNNFDQNFFLRHGFLTAFFILGNPEDRQAIYSAYRFTCSSSTDEKTSLIRAKFKLFLVKIISDILFYLSTIALVVLAALAFTSVFTVPMMPLIALATVFVASVAADLYYRWVRPAQNNDKASDNVDDINNQPILAHASV